MQVVFETVHGEVLSLAALAALHWFNNRRRKGRLRIEGPDGQVLVLPDTPFEDAKSVIERWSTEAGGGQSGDRGDR